MSYAASIDDTVSYINRFQTFNLSLAPNPDYNSSDPASLPFVLTPTLRDTTLLSSLTPLVYGTGAGLSENNGTAIGSGKPALNSRFVHYFTGRSDNFDPTKPSTNPNNARLDPESIRVSNDGLTVFISDEYGPYVYQFNRITGQRIRSFTLPPKFAVTNLSPVGNTEISGNTSGRVANKGMEGLAITPDGRTLVGAMQSPLIQDGGTDGAYTRIITIDIWTGATHEYAYKLDNIGTPAKPKYPTVSDIVAINSHQFLLDERDGKGLGDGSIAVFKKLYEVDLAGATEVSGITGAANLADKEVTKTLFLDVVAALNPHGISSGNIPAKLEGVAFGQDVTIDGVTKHTLYVANDNDFSASVNSVDNPNKFFVFAFSDGDLTGYVPQQITPRTLLECGINP